MLRELTLFGWRDKVEIAIERIRQFVPPEGYWLAFSGGKDSVTLKWLAQQSGVPFTSHYNVIPVDPPELIEFIRTQHPDVVFERPRKPFMELFMENGFPVRAVRWCCRELKEHGGDGRIVLSGVRWAESSRRRNRHNLVSHWQNKTLVNPIIDWEDEDIWQYIRENKIPYCSLYDEGWRRLGCVLCPMTRKVDEQIARWPKVAEIWHRCFLKFYEKCGGSRRASHREKKERWSSGEALWLAWLNRDGSMRGDLWPNECDLFAGAGTEKANEPKEEEMTDGTEERGLEERDSEVPDLWEGSQEG